MSSFEIENLNINDILINDDNEKVNNNENDKENI
jgi:hypothetical protein